MSKSHFRLSTLLRMRERTRDQRRSELAEVRRRDAELQRRLAAIEHQQIELQQQYRGEVGPGEVDVQRLLQVQQFATALKEDAAEILRQRDALAAEIDRRRQALVEADRNLQVLVKLRENQAQSERQEENRQEHKLLDEAALQSFK